MSDQLKGRKKHAVKGNVKEIKKSEEALNVESVGEKKRTSVLKNKV